MKRMKHEKHGFTHAENGSQESYLRSLGWVEENESFDDETINKSEEIPQEIAIKKRGRPRQS